MLFNDYDAKTAADIEKLKDGGDECEDEAWGLLDRSIEDMGGCALMLDSIEALVGDGGEADLPLVQDSLSMVRRSLFSAYNAARAAYGALY